MSDFEREDMELAEMMGGQFIDATQEPEDKPVEMPVYEKPNKPAKNVPEKEKPVDAHWMPAKPEPNTMDKLRNTARDVCMFGSLSLILFWWQQTGKLDYTTAWYALLICVGMVFFSVGRHWGWKK